MEFQIFEGFQVIKLIPGEFQVFNVSWNPNNPEYGVNTIKTMKILSVSTKQLYELMANTCI